jgi:benzoyl-CoA reductase/2-hydroxyglutaryl-CoA dehydratase subunit BcrC/BadD/HgdB
MRVLAEAYFGSITNIGERPNNRIFLWIKKTIESFGIRGMVIVRYIWCDKWHSEVRRLREWLNIPVLDIELGPERIDERTMNRVEAFMEILA